MGTTSYNTFACHNNLSDNSSLNPLPGFAFALVVSSIHVYAPIRPIALAGVL